MEKRKVFITGMGCISPLGIGVTSLWNGLLAGRSAARTIQGFDASSLPVQIAAEVSGYTAEDHFSARELKRLDRFVQFALVAAEEAALQAKLSTGEDRSRIGVSIGTGVGGLETFCEQHEVLQKEGARRISPFFIPRLITNLAAGHVAMRHNLQGPSGTASTACCSGAHALVDAFRAIALGEADIMVAGGAEAPIQPLGIAGFAAMKALSTRNEDPARASRPSDMDRDGFVMGEGAAVLILESEASALARGAQPLAEFLGYGLSTDAHHLTAPCPDGRGAIQAMQAALRMARLEPADIGYINAHGTSTPQNDAIESLAISAVFPARTPPISSTKSMIGHLLGASGAVEAIATALTLSSQTAHPTINLDKPDPACPLDYIPHRARSLEARHALSNSFAFGGLNVCLALGKA